MTSNTKSTYIFKPWQNNKDYSEVWRKCKTDASIGLGWHDDAGGGINVSLYKLTTNQLLNSLRAHPHCRNADGNIMHGRIKHIMKMFAYLKEMKDGDHLLIARGSRDIHTKCVIVGKYYFDPRPNDPLWFPHRIRFAATSLNPPRQSTKRLNKTIHKA